MWLANHEETEIANRRVEDRKAGHENLVSVIVPLYRQRMSTSPQGVGRTVLEHDAQSLADYILSFRWEYRDEEMVKAIVGGGMPLWQEILSVIPQTAQRGTLLELGSPPFNLTLLIGKLRNYDLTLAAA